MSGNFLIVDVLKVARLRWWVERNDISGVAGEGLRKDSQFLSVKFGFACQSQFVGVGSRSNGHLAAECVGNGS